MTTATAPHNRIAIVTGAGSGVGRAAATALLQAGWRVVFCGRREETLQAAIAAAGDPFGDIAERALALPADVTDAAAVHTLFESARQRFGRIDLVFNNAGTSAPAVPIDEQPLDAWHKVVATNLNGVYYCMREAFRVMKAQQPRGGRIINNGSISAYTPRPHSFAYTSTKHAVAGLTKTGALEGRAHDIAVGQIDIGNAATDMTERMTKGVPQADGSMKVEPRMDVRHVGDAIVHMASLPLDANVLSMTVMATTMPYVGRG